MRNRNWIALVGAALVAAGCASGGRDGPPPGFGDDEPGDGPPQPRAQLFVSPAGQPFRAPAGQPYPVSAWFAQADADHDGRLTRDEFRADADVWLKALDPDGDGQVSMPEATRWEEELVPEVSRSGVGMRGVSDRRSGAAARNTVDTRLQGAAAYSLINEPHPIRGADSDFSFGVSRAEWRAASDRRFVLLDVDGDGGLRLADLKPTPAQAMAAGRPGKRSEPPPPQGGPRRRR